MWLLFLRVRALSGSVPLQSVESRGGLAFCARKSVAGSRPGNVEARDRKDIEDDSPKRGVPSTSWRAISAGPERARDGIDSLATLSLVLRRADPGSVEESGRGTSENHRRILCSENRSIWLVYGSDMLIRN